MSGHIRTVHGYDSLSLVLSVHDSFCQPMGIKTMLTFSQDAGSSIPLMTVCDWYNSPKVGFVVLGSRMMSKVNILRRPFFFSFFLS